MRRVFHLLASMTLVFGFFGAQLVVPLFMTTKAYASDIPETTIDDQPANPSDNTAPNFSFSSNLDPVTFECSLDSSPFSACVSPYTASGLTSGSHTFAVRATNAFAETDPSPASYSWVVDTNPPDTTITRLGPTPSAPEVNFILSSNETATFMCSLDAGDFQACDSDYVTPTLSDGPHTLDVYATDAAGNEDLSHAVQTWMVGSAPYSYGDGQAGRPYRITSCAGLQGIGADLSARYVIVRDIDCGGNPFSTIGSEAEPFTGVLDGEGHTVSGLNLGFSGLFKSLSTATIRNISLGGNMAGGEISGSLADTTDDSLIQSVHSFINIFGTHKTIGGLVGVLGGGSSIVDSSFTGQLWGVSIVGGLIGTNSGQDWISDSYVKTTMHTVGSVTPYDFGGIAGVADTGMTITHVYSAGQMAMIVGAHNIGGLVGLDSGAVVGDSFSAITIHGNGAHGVNMPTLNVGQVVGDYEGDGSNFSGVYYDPNLSPHNLTCAGTGLSDGPGCEPVDTTADAQYFKGNSTNAPFAGGDSNWDFSDSGYWMTVDGDYPQLRSAVVNDAGVPNDGDLNGDSIGDNTQSNVADLSDGFGIWTAITIPAESGCEVANPSWYDKDTFADSDPQYTYPTPYKIGFRIYCPNPGMTVPVTIVYDKQYDTSQWVMRFYDTNTRQSSTIPGATYSTISVGGEPKTTATYNVTDNGSFDQNNANGVIDDPVSGAIFTAANITTPNANVPAKFAGIGVPNTGLGRL